METIENFLDAPTLNICRYRSPFETTAAISSQNLADALNLRAGGFSGGFVEYVLASVFTEVTDHESFSKRYIDHNNEVEARAILSAARNSLEALPASDLEGIKGLYIQFEGENPFLAQDNAYGKLIMEIANAGEIKYIDKNDALYDIYCAGTALQALYLKHIGPCIGSYLNMPAFKSCVNYYDVFATVKAIDPELAISLMKKETFIQLMRAIITLGTGTWEHRAADMKWIVDEFEHSGDIGFLQRVYLSIEDKINEKYMEKELTDNFSSFVSEVISKIPRESQEMYSAQMVSMFSGDNRIMLEFARRYYAIKGSKPMNTPAIIREIVNVDFMPEKISIINTNVVYTITGKADLLPLLGFDCPKTNIGSAAYRSMISDIGFMATSNNYDNLRDEYRAASRAHFRNLFSATVLAAIAPFNGSGFLNKKIIFDNDYAFLGGNGNNENFVGKALELMINNRMQSPSHSRAQSPARSPALYYNPMSPVGFRAPRANILLRVGTSDKFEVSVNVDYINSMDYFTIETPSGIDARIVQWVNSRFKMFVTFYIYLHTNFVAPARFDLEIFYRDVYAPFINNLVDPKDEHALSVISQSFRPNNEISRLFVKLIVSNFSVILTQGKIDTAKFLDFKDKGIKMLKERRYTANPIPYVARKLETYFNFGGVTSSPMFMHLYMFLLFSKGQYMNVDSLTVDEDQLRKFWSSMIVQ